MSERDFAALVKEHQQRKAALKADNDKKRAEVVESAGAYTDRLMDSVNSEVAAAFNNERALEAEIKQLQKETSDFVKRSNQWAALVASFNQSLKEMGDVENWSRTIESDMAEVAAKLEYVHAQQVPH